jgi:hypothetical protein
MDSDEFTDGIDRRIHRVLDDYGVFDRRSLRPVAEYIRASDNFVGRVSAALARAAGVADCGVPGAVGELSFATGIVSDDIVDGHLERHGQRVRYDRAVEVSSLIRGSETAVTLLTSEMGSGAVRHYSDTVDLIYESVCETHAAGLELEPGSIVFADDEIDVQSDTYLNLAVQRTSFSSGYSTRSSKTNDGTSRWIRISPAYRSRTSSGTISPTSSTRARTTSDPVTTWPNGTSTS